MKKAYVDLSRGQMHYRYAGETGEPVILLHMSGSSSDEYETVGTILSARYRVYAIDLYGFGGSDRPENYLSFHENMETVLEFMDAMKIERANLVGNLVGANISVHFCAEHPDRVLKAVFFHPCYNEDPKFFINMRHGPVYTPVFPAADGSHLAVIWSRCDKYGETPEVTDARARCVHMAADRGEALHWALCEDEDFESYVRRVQAPAKAFGYSKMDHKSVKQAADLMKNCKYELLDPASPYFARATPELCAQKIAEFIG